LSQPIITLTTDFGANDHLAGAMKGAILRILPEATIVDISHHVMPFDLLDAALTIGQAYRFFPRSTIHVVVVDPGVGSQRRPLLVSGDQHYFVAPDNGVLSMVYDREERLTVRHITAEHYFLTPVSNTFHGRDIFAPVAAWLAKNGQPNSFGEAIQDFVRFTMPRPKPTEKGFKGVILKVDNFGNLITNFSAEDTPQLLSGGPFKITVNGKEITRLVQNYAQGGPGEVFAVVGSSGFVEISMNRGNAARSVGASRGAEVTLAIG
jgi:hypothetical protein